ncbi:SLAIN motif-containing protein-like [Sebastes fasciatus]|uniref:SLAIN motif-containing protein-like n=1 Tax=Sebastes fasciatus TaxID=394691 RepID=UPI003D9DDDEE
MELQNQLTGDWRRYFCNQPPVEFDTSANHHLLCKELKSSSVRLEGNSDPYYSVWTDAERARVKSCNNRSFAMDARIRLDNLKSGCNNSPCCATDGMLYNYNCQKDLWDREESQEEESALDLVELLDVEDDVQDEESWLYESPKKQVFVERSESALRWCRHVLDNPSPEMELACRLLINRLDQRSSGHFYRGSAVFHHVGSSMDKTSVSTTHNISDSSDNYELGIFHDSMTTSYRLQDTTDVHFMARVQEASLRQDYVPTPARRRPESPPGLSSLSASPRQSPTPVAKRGCPKLARLHQQVTQFKLLKLAQNQATSPGRTRSPLRTSLRSLQAVRNSRSLDTDNCPSADQITDPPSGASSVKKGLSCWSPSLCAAPMNSNGSLHSARDSSDRATAVRRLLRSQSLSPCRIPHLSVHGRVFASPDRSTSEAWGRNVPSTQR